MSRCREMLEVNERGLMGFSQVLDGWVSTSWDQPSQSLMPSLATSAEMQGLTEPWNK